MPANHSQTPTPYHPGRRAYHPALDSPQARAKALSPSVAIDFGLPPSPYNILPPGTVVPSPIVSPTAVYPSPIAPPPLASARGGYHSQTSSPTAYHPRSALRRNTDGTYFETQPPSQSRVEARQKNVIVVADEPREHGPRDRDPIPGTPHWKSGTLPRGDDGSVISDPTDRRGLRLDTSDALLRPSHALESSPIRTIRRIESPLYDPEPHRIYYKYKFSSMVPTDGAHGGAAMTAVPGLTPGSDNSPTLALKDAGHMCFNGKIGTIVLIFQPEGYEAVTKSVNLPTSGQGFRLSTVASSACELVRGFYHSHRELDVDPYMVVPIGIFRQGSDPNEGGRYVVVAGVAQ